MSKAQMNFVSWVHGVATEGSVSWWETSQKNDKGYGLSPQKNNELQNQKMRFQHSLGIPQNEMLTCKREKDCCSIGNLTTNLQDRVTNQSRGNLRMAPHLNIPNQDDSTLASWLSLFCKVCSKPTIKGTETAIMQKNHLLRLFPKGQTVPVLCQDIRNGGCL